jgi:hypothetical protein
LAASTTKKAVLLRYDREPLRGYLNTVSYLQPTGIELLSEQGNVSTVTYSEVKFVAFVREFEAVGETDRRVFHSRPKMEGLWASFHFRDGDVMEGIVANNLLQLEPHGFTVIPPDPFSNVQRLFVPRASVLSVEILGVIRGPLKKRRPKPAPKEQIELFEE